MKLGQAHSKMAQSQEQRLGRQHCLMRVLVIFPATIPGKKLNLEATEPQGTSEVDVIGQRQWVKEGTKERKTVRLGLTSWC